MADLTIEGILDLLEVPEAKRKRLAFRARKTVDEMGLVDFSHIYRVVIDEIERLDIPYVERLVVSLDAPRSDEDSRTLLDKLAAPLSEEDPRDSVAIENLPQAYAPYVAEIRTLMGGDAADVLLSAKLVDIDTLRDRIAKLRRLQRTRMYVIPPERPVKELYFSEDNTLVMKLGSMPPGYDAVGYYRRWYDGIYLEDLRHLNPSLYSKLQQDGLAHGIPRRNPKRQKQRNWSIIDPVDIYMREYYPMTRTNLMFFDSGLYQALNKRGRLSIVPLKKRRRRSDWFSDAYLKRLLKELIG